MYINQQLIRAIALPEETHEKIDMASNVVDDICLKLLEFLTNDKCRFAIMYGDQDKRFLEFKDNKEDIAEYTKEELLTIFKETL